MNNLNIDLETAKQKFDESPEWLKLEMLKTFGTDFNKKYTDIKSFEDACRVLNIDPSYINGYKLSKQSIAFEKIGIIIQAINGDWKADFSDSNQKKFYNVYTYSVGSGLRFSATHTSYVHTYTSIGARLSFESREKAEYFGKTFIDLINEYML
jgi:hypothetical protein